MSGRRGLAQDARLPAALEPHYIDVDELTPAQLAAMALQYAGLVRFAMPGDGAPSAGARDPETWRNQLAGDEALALAEILSLRLHQHDARFEELLDQALDSVALGGAPLPRQALPTYLMNAIVGRLEAWARVLHASRTQSGADMGSLITGVLAQLPSEMQDALNYQRQRAGWDARADPRNMVAGLAGQLGLAQQGAARDDALRAQIRGWFKQLVHAVEMIRRAAAARLRLSLASGQHDPGAGIVLAFVQLYGRVQQQANRLTERHLDFYYEQVLRMRPRAAQPDAAFLVFEPAAPGARIRIAPGTAFLAPSPGQRSDLVYLGRDALQVGDTRLRSLYTLYCERNPDTAPENGLFEGRHGAPVQYPTGCRVASLPLPEPGAVRGLRAPAAYALFGAPRTHDEAAPGRPARLGFALASEVLAMREGVRAVHVMLHLEAEREDGVHGRHGQRLSERLRAAGRLMDESEDGVVFKVLRRMFRLALTGAAGWIALPCYSAAFEPAGAGERHEVLHLRFTLPHEAGAVVAHDPALHGDDGVDVAAGVAPGRPMLRFELNGDGYLYPYGLLRGLSLVKAQVDVDVRGHRSLVLHNALGELSAAAPFQPFGPLPADGAWLVVGSLEAACKRLTGARLVLEWGGLPRVPGGLRAWYGGYENRPYRPMRCTLAVLADGRWQPPLAAERPRQPLLAGDEADGGWADGARVDVVDLGPVLYHARPLPARAPGAPFVWRPGTSGGFFRLTLDAGRFAFGHQEYPLQLARTLTRNSQGRLRRDPAPLPNPPYTPLVESVALDYTASATIVPAPGTAASTSAGQAPPGDALLRLHPFGWEAARGGSEGGSLLLPPLDYAGNLYLGLDPSAAGAPLTLFFHLVEDALPMAQTHARQISWSYLAGDGWMALPPYAILADSTHGFQRPGIVTLALPADCGQTSTIMPPGQLWLRVSCEHDLNRFCQLYSVHPHALQVSRDLAQSPAGAPARVEAGSIRRPRNAIAGLGRITQMTASSGGRLEEDRRQLRRRTAERLRHKGRAVTAHDVERLVLERFPEIDRVKCFPNLSIGSRPDGGASPGHVLVVALPQFVSQGHMSVYPRLHGDLVEQVRTYLAERADPGAAIEVANPFYQRIQVRCTVRLAPGVDQGRCVNMLDRVISDFISPWSDAGNTSLFGWAIRQHDIEAFILAQEGVRGVSEFSMLSVSEVGSERYLLADTAVAGSDGRPSPDVLPRYPWSVAVPLERHAIRVADSEQSRAARRTGIGKLQIGATFILSSEPHP